MDLDPTQLNKFMSRQNKKALGFKALILVGAIGLPGTIQNVERTPPDKDGIKIETNSALEYLAVPDSVLIDLPTMIGSH